MKKLNYGMVGGGAGSFIGQAHRRAIRIDDLAQLTAGCFSRSAEISRKTGTELGVADDRCYASFQEMAAAEAAREDGIDFVVITTPNVSHYPACKAFLEAGIPVSCEKPLCLTLEQALELQALARQKDLPFMVAYTYMGHVTAKHIRRYIQGGNLGKIRMVMAEYPQGWLAHEDDWGGKQGQWRCDPSQAGKVNCLGDLGTHIENAVSMMTGLKIRRVLARLEHQVPNRVLDDNDVVLLEYEGGATGCYWASQVAIGHDNDLRVRIFGENGTIEWRQETSEQVLVTTRDGIRTDLHRGDAGILPGAAKYGRLPSGHTEGWLESMANLYRSFCQCLNAKKEGIFVPEMIDYPTVDDGVEGVRFVEACLASSEAGGIWVDL
ncbi:MAG: Gfo/Idh/MocA family oxidoreductase [Clostridiales bacterium]|nr:Gfo/Idh/MocA family oxidoreductase [Clostridiales bacterium]